MPETLPMLEKDPRTAFRITRLARILLFSLVASMAIVGLLIATVRFAWDTFAAPLLDQGPYVARIEYVLPAILFVALLLSKLLWDAANERPPKLRTR